jgi:hypothetical protein
METILSNEKFRGETKTIILDFLALATIFFLPAFSHLLNFPLYLLEPMRAMLILSIALTNKRNAYLIAVSLPFFSFFISAHPNIYKTVLIALELSANVWLFYLISDKLKNKFSAMLLSILLSKIGYYALKFAMIYFVLLNTELISTPIYLQAITMIAFTTSLHIFYVYREKKS